MLDNIGIALGIIALIILFLPPKYDPLIRWKEHLEGWHKKDGKN